LLRLSSLSTRLIIAVVATAAAAFAASFGLTIVRLDQGLERQAEQLSRLSEEKLGQRLDGEARLAGARVEGLFSSTGSRLESIAQRADVVKAISSANVVAIWELLGRAAQAADIDGILVVDTKLRVFGADSDKTDIVTVNRALQESPLAQSAELLQPSPSAQRVVHGPAQSTALSPWFRIPSEQLAATQLPPEQ